MDAKRILKFLRQLSANNNRPWFQDHKQEYETIRADFEHGVQQALERIVTFDTSIAHLTVKDCTYRFYRDTRFSNDKSPYKKSPRRLHLRPRQEVAPRGLLPAPGAWPLHGGLWQLLAAHEHPHLVSQRDHGQHGGMAAMRPEP